MMRRTHLAIVVCQIVSVAVKQALELNIFDIYIYTQFTPVTKHRFPVNTFLRARRFCAKAAWHGEERLSGFQTKPLGMH